MLVLSLAIGWAQDERRVVSPDGRLEFRIFVAQPPDGESRLAYRILFDGRPLVDTSYLGFNIHNQEPFLGEKVGLIGSRVWESGGARCLEADYMQNGSIGRLLNIEARVWNGAVAFRYVIPRSIALEELLIDDELTEFDVGAGFRATRAALPLTVTRPGMPEVKIEEVTRPPYPPVTLAARGDGVLRTMLARGPADAVTAFEGRTPFVGPWRIVSVGAEPPEGIREALRRDRY